MAVTLTAGSRRVLRYSPGMRCWSGSRSPTPRCCSPRPSVPLIGIGLWWTANTVAHNFIHTPFFRSRALNRAYSLFLSALMGIPQSLWRERHLRHHRRAARRVIGSRGRTIRRRRVDRRCCGGDGLVLTLWAAVAAADPAFFLRVYAPGYLAGLGLCSLQGHFEHARGTTSHYGWLYNWCFFNDGYHAEHHLRPGEHWTRLPSQPLAAARASRWPPVLRWLDAFSLESLERLVLRSPRLQRFVLAVARTRVRGAAAAASTHPSRHHRRRRPVSAERAGPAAAAARRDR